MDAKINADMDLIIGEQLKKLSDDRRRLIGNIEKNKERLKEIDEKLRAYTGIKNLIEKVI